MFKKTKRRIRQYKLWLFELSEAIGSLCTYLGHANHGGIGSDRYSLIVHGRALREYSEFLRQDLFPTKEEENEKLGRKRSGVSLQERESRLGRRELRLWL